jgi:hypothetical protein
MHYQLEIPDYDPEIGSICGEMSGRVRFAVQTDGGAIAADREGLMTLARCLLALADPAVPYGNHIHLDTSTLLEEGSAELVLERSEFPAS